MVVTSKTCNVRSVISMRRPISDVKCAKLNKVTQISLNFLYLFISLVRLCHFTAVNVYYTNPISLLAIHSYSYSAEHVGLILYLIRPVQRSALMTS